MTVKRERCWTLYLIEAENGFLYTGITKDVRRRFQEHHSSKKSAKFFRRSPPKKLVYQKNELTHSEALKEEYRVKKLTKPEKLKMIRSLASTQKKIAMLTRLRLKSDGGPRLKSKPKIKPKIKLRLKTLTKTKSQGNAKNKGRPKSRSRK